MRIYEIDPRKIGRGYDEIEDRRRRRSDGTYMGYGMYPSYHHEEKMRELDRREAELERRERTLREKEGKMRRVGYESYPEDHYEEEGYYDYPEYRGPVRRYY